MELVFGDVDMLAQILSWLDTPTVIRASQCCQLILSAPSLHSIVWWSAFERCAGLALSPQAALALSPSACRSKAKSCWVIKHGRVAETEYDHTPFNIWDHASMNECKLHLQLGLLSVEKIARVESMVADAKVSLSNVESLQHLDDAQAVTLEHQIETLEAALAQQPYIAPTAVCVTAMVQMPDRGRAGHSATLINDPLGLSTCALFFAGATDG